MTYFWAKTISDGMPGISVYDHLVNVGCVARCIAETNPELLARFNLRASEVGALAALHDLGKISPGFQQKSALWLEMNGLIKVARNGCWDTATESDHGKVSHSAIQDFLIQQGIARRAAKYLATVLGGHHGRLKLLPNDRGIRPPFIKQTTDSLSSIDWQHERFNSAQQVWNFFDAEGLFDSLCDDHPALWWLAGLTSVADWIGSDERFFPGVSIAAKEDVALIARHALDSIGLFSPPLNRGLTFEQIFPFPPNEMQTKTFSAINGPGVYIIEAPMGMGKTEAALGAAYQLLSAGKASGIYFALPTQATSNRIHLRMNEFLHRILSAPDESRLIHGNSWLLKEDLEYRPASSGTWDKPTEDARNGRDWFASAKRALLAPYGVGTIDQALLGVVAAKHFFVRHFALAGKVVILDEVHSYDLYTGTLIDKLIMTLEKLGCTVIVLSATLTGKRLEQIVATSEDENTERPYPLISGRTEGQAFDPVTAAAPKPQKVKVDFKASDTAVEEALAVARKGGAVLWICNTVDASQKYFNRLRALVQDGFPLGLLHSRFPYWRRDDLEKVWMERFGKKGETRCGSILVSTQVVEQSVDLDADLLITELAPTDMLLQRLGRLWRHKRENRPTAAARICIIEETVGLDEFGELSPKKIKEGLGSKAFVYDPYILLRTLEVWRGRDEITLPGEIRSVLEATYRKREDESASWQELLFENEAESLAYRQKAIMSSNIWQAALDDREGVQTRLNEMPTVSMVLCRSMTGQGAQFVDGTTADFSGVGFLFGTAKAVHRNLVKVPEYCFDRVESCAEFDEYIHDSHCAGIVGEDGAIIVKGLKSKIRLHYSDELGLFIERLSGKEDA